MTKSEAAPPAAPESGGRQILVIDETSALATFVRFCLALRWPEIRAIPYSAGRGLPPRDFDWDAYCLVIVRQELSEGHATGRDWAQAVKLRRPDMPVILATSQDAHTLMRRAGHKEVDLCLDLIDMSPRVLLAAVARLLGLEVDPEILGRDHTHEVKTRRMGAAKGAAKGDDRGPRVPGYVNERTLASGGMGTIVLARRQEDGCEVILKFLGSKAMKETELLQRFMREYDVIGKLRHANVVRVYDRGFAAEFAYISMEYMPAGDLRERLGEPLGIERTTDFLRQMVVGLGAAHDLGIVHRDLKPGNILFRDDTSLAISDFGIAKDLTTLSSVTIPGSFLGTPYYASPEQLLGRMVDGRSDLYALGVMLFQMLTGRRPYDGKNTGALADAHVNAPIPLLPQELYRFQPLVNGLLAKDPDDRFQSTAELLDGIDWCVAHTSVAAVA